MNTKKRTPPSDAGFTLIEVLLSVGIIAALLAAVVYTLNPSQLLDQGSDGNRIAGIGTLDKAIGLYYSSAIDSPGTLSMGSSSVIYISIPDPNATSSAGTNCAGLGFVSTGTTVYHCAGPSNYLKTDGTGWIPINFASSAVGSSISALPVDPVNTTSSGEYYVYLTNGTQYELMSKPASVKDAPYTQDFVKGSSIALLTSFPGFSGSSGVCDAWSPQNPDLWIVNNASSNSPYVTELSSNGVFCSNAVPEGGGNGQFNGSPIYDAIDANGNVWVTHQGPGVTASVEEFSSTGTYISQFGSFSTLGYPLGIAVDASGNIWVVGAGVEEFSPTGTYIFGIDDGGSRYFSPEALAIDGSGNIWVTTENARVMEFTKTGTYLQEIGQGNGCGDTDQGCWSGVGQPSSTANGNFNNAYGIAIAPDGNVWVADTFNNRVEEFNASGTYLGQLGCATGGCSAGSGNGQFNDPYGVAIDTNGNIWVADSNNYRIEEFSSTGAYESQVALPGDGAYLALWGIAVH